MHNSCFRAMQNHNTCKSLGEPKKKFSVFKALLEGLFTHNSSGECLLVHAKRSKRYSGTFHESSTPANLEFT